MYNRYKEIEGFNQKVIKIITKIVMKRSVNTWI